MLQPPEHMLLHLPYLPHKYRADKHSPLTGTPQSSTGGQAWGSYGQPRFLSDGEPRLLPAPFVQAPLCSVPARASGETGTTWPKPLNFLYFQNYNYRKLLLPKSPEI